MLHQNAKPPAGSTLAITEATLPRIYTQTHIDTNLQIHSHTHTAILMANLHVYLGYLVAPNGSKKPLKTAGEVVHFIF